ncbi:MAG: branched-chain amino acid ABC transporter permease, partial [Synergistaceae bacterium]|nr:branched-chain amino acid ABC transporter permease [Synergistaceae bacterium]
MKTKIRDGILNLLVLGALGCFLWWAPKNLDGYKLRIINLIAINAILGLSLNLIYGMTGMF